MVPSNIGAESGLKAISSAFYVVIDWVIRESTRDSENDIRWKMRNRLGDLDFCRFLIRTINIRVKSGEAAFVVFKISPLISDR